MTEDAWLRTRRGAVGMMTQVGRKLSRRRALLLGVAVYRSLWPDLADEVGVVERFADDRATDDELAAVRDRVGREPADYGSPAMHLQFLLNVAVWGGTARLIGWAASPFDGYPQPLPARRAAVCDLIREVAGNPFKPWKAIPAAMGGGLVQPDGRTVFPSEAARLIAAGVHEEQAFERLPVLADALEDSGVTDAELLAHCRRPGGHLRGCWAVDVVLGRA